MRCDSGPELQEIHSSTSPLKQTALIKVIFKRKKLKISWVKLIKYRDLNFFVISGSR